MTRFLLAGFLATIPLAGQTAITTSASRSLIVTPDQTDLSLTVTADLSKTQDDVVAVLAGVGVKAENLVGISTGGSFSSLANQLTAPPVTLNYQFQISIPLTTWKDTLTKLDVLA